jgi:hypothetical protein
MILRRFGSRVLSVKPAFDARAMTEIGFQRDGEVTMTAEEFDAQYAPVATHELAAEAKGDVQGEVEEAVLGSLRDQIARLEAGLARGEVLVVASESGVDYPKTRGKQTTIVVESENRLVFEYAVSPPLRIAVYRKR